MKAEKKDFRFTILGFSLRLAKASLPGLLNRNA